MNLIMDKILDINVSKDEDDVGNANDHVDTALENLRKDPDISKHLDPLLVPGFDGDNYNVRNLKVRGLLSLFRHGDCSLSYNGETSNIVVKVAVKDVSITMDYSAKALFFWINGDGLIDIEHLEVKLSMSSIVGIAQLNSFKVVKLGDYHVRKMTGLGFVLNWLLKMIGNNIVQNSRQNIINALENEAGKTLGELLKKI